MSFLSPAYFCFFPLAACLYFLLPQRMRNIWLLGCSWFFYLCTGPESMPFLLSVSVITWLGGMILEKRPQKGILILLLCLAVGILFLFKYLNFAAQLTARFLQIIGLDWSGTVPALLLPAGISFYLFAAMGYLIDIYRGKYLAERRFVFCALFLSFFPSLLSGPIGRYERLRPQLEEKHPFCYRNLKEGLLRFLWGSFKKLVLADRLAVVADTVFANPAQFGSMQVLLAACAFSCQIYCDFSAYSDLAIGSAKVMGFELMENFRTPYFSRSIGEFWRRWHISLSSWFRDYLYIPLGGSRIGVWRKYGNLLIVFAVSGLWHGAATTFLIWGLLNGCYQVVGGLTQPVRQRIYSALPVGEDHPLIVAWQRICVFALSTVAWIFFESGSMQTAIAVLTRMVQPGLWTVPLSAMGMDRLEFLAAGCGLLLLFVVDWVSQRVNITQWVLERPRLLRWCINLGLLMIVVIFGSYGSGYDAKDFIYGRF